MVRVRACSAWSATCRCRAWTRAWTARLVTAAARCWESSWFSSNRAPTTLGVSVSICSRPRTRPHCLASEALTGRAKLGFSAMNSRTCSKRSRYTPPRGAAWPLVPARDSEAFPLAGGPWVGGVGEPDGTLLGVGEMGSALTAASPSGRPLPRGLGEGVAAVVGLFPQVLVVAVGELEAGGDRRFGAGGGAVLLALQRGERPVEEPLRGRGEELAADQVAGGGGVAAADQVAQPPGRLVHDLAELVRVVAGEPRRHVQPGRRLLGIELGADQPKLDRLQPGAEPLGLGDAPVELIDLQGVHSPADRGAQPVHLAGRQHQRGRIPHPWQLAIRDRRALGGGQGGRVIEGVAVPRRMRDGRMVEVTRGGAVQRQVPPRVVVRAWGWGGGHRATSPRSSSQVTASPLRVWVR